MAPALPLRRVVVEIDPEEGQIAFHDAAGFQPPPGAVAVPVTSFRGLPLVRARVEGLPEGDFLLGTTGDIVLSRTVTAAVRRGGPRGSLLRGHGLWLGGILLEGPEIVVRASEPPSLPGHPGLIGVLGLGAFGGRAVTFDLPHGRILLEPAGRPRSLIRSGMELSLGEDPFAVTATASLLPAAAAGLKVGDRIEALDAEPLEPGSLSRVRRLVAGRPGEKVEVEVSRKGERVKLGWIYSDTLSGLSWAFEAPAEVLSLCRRIDHALASPLLDPSIRSVSYTMGLGTSQEGLLDPARLRRTWTRGAGDRYELAGVERSPGVRPTEELQADIEPRYLALNELILPPPTIERLRGGVLLMARQEELTKLQSRLWSVTPGLQAVTLWLDDEARPRRAEYEILRRDRSRYAVVLDYRYRTIDKEQRLAGASIVYRELSGGREPGETRPASVDLLYSKREGSYWVTGLGSGDASVPFEGPTVRR